MDWPNKGREYGQRLVFGKPQTNTAGKPAVGKRQAVFHGSPQSASTSSTTWGASTRSGGEGGPHVLEGPTTTQQQQQMKNSTKSKVEYILSSNNSRQLAVREL